MNFYKTTVKPVSDLVEYEDNPRTHSDEQVAQLAESIARFGFTNPILIDEKNNVIAGHGRLEAARLIELESVPVVVVTGLSKDERRALVIADNKLALNAEWDFDRLCNELESLSTDLRELTGFSETEILALLKPAKKLTESDEFDEVSETLLTHRCPRCNYEFDD